MNDWQLCGLSLRPGEKRQTVLRVPMEGTPNGGSIGPGSEKRGREGDYEIPATLINGARPGKTLLVTASIHSGEYVGVPAVIRTAAELDPAKMSGRVILLHCVNTSGFWGLSPALVPEDGYNLNHGYPPPAEKRVGGRIAAWFLKELLPQADFLFDLHGGSQSETMTPLIFYPDAPGVTAEALAAAKALDVETLVESEARDGEYSYAANFLSIPGLLHERGSGLFVTEAEVEEDRRQLRLLMDHLGVYPAEGWTRAEKPRRIFHKAVYLDADTQGLWYPSAGLGETVPKGRSFGRLEDFFGNVVREYIAPEDITILYYNAALAIRPGDFLTAYGLNESVEEY